MADEIEVLIRQQALEQETTVPLDETTDDGE